jgi:hypothetical protein
VKFDIKVSCIRTKTVRVEADSPEAAEAEARRRAPDEDYSGVAVDYAYDTGEVVPIEEEGRDDLACFFCGATKKNVEEAIASDWSPSFYIGEEEQDGPACADCCGKYLVLEEDAGELVLKPEYAEGTFVSVWDDGDTEHKSPCIVNLRTREVLVLGEAHEAEEEDVLDEEYVLVNGEKSRACPADRRGHYSEEEQRTMFFRGGRHHDEPEKDE